MKFSGLKENCPSHKDADNDVMVLGTVKTVGARVRKAGISFSNAEPEVVKDCSKTVFLVALKEKGHAALKKGKLQLAVNLYTQAILQEKPSPALLTHRANAYLKLQNYDKVVEDCSKIIDLQPNFWTAYALRADAFRQQGKFDQAMTDLRQAKNLHPRKADTFHKLILKCKREIDTKKMSLLIARLTEEAEKLPPRPYIKRDKRVTLGQHILRIQDCLSVIGRVLDQPGHGAIVWEQDQSDKWRRKRVSDSVGGKKKRKEYLDYDLLIVVSRLEDLHSALKEVGIEGSHAVALAKGFPILLSAYEFHEDLVLEIISELCRYGDECIIRAFLRAKPLPTLLCALQTDSETLRRKSLQLLDLAAAFKPQLVLCLLMKEKLFHVIFKSMHSGLVSEHDSSVSLFFKLVLDPRLPRHLLSQSLLSEDLCLGLSRACRADRAVTRLYGAQAIAILLEYEKSKEGNTELALVPARTSGEGDDNLPLDDDEIGKSVLTLFVRGGVLAAVVGLLCRESHNAPDRIDDYAPCMWEGDVELICEQIGGSVSEFSEFDECTLRRFDLLSGYGQVMMLNALRALDRMVEARGAVEVLERVAVWGSFVSLLSSFPHCLAALTAQILAKLCQRDKRVAFHLSNLWPENSSLILMELARLAKDMEDWVTHQAAMLILSTLAGYKSFLNVMQNPTSFTLLVNLFQSGQSVTAVSSGCTCLTIAVTNSNDCMEFAELHASPLVNKLLGLWCEFRKAEKVRFQVEELLYVLMKRSNSFQDAIMVAFKSGKLTDFRRSPSESQKLLGYQTPEFPTLRIRAPEPVYKTPKISALNGRIQDEPRVLSHHDFAMTGINFTKVIDFISSVDKLQPYYKFADLCAGPGFLSVQLAKHFRDAHCFAVSCKQAWVEHTRRIAKHESLQNLTSVLSRGLDMLPQALPSKVNVAILCSSLQGIHDLGRLFQALSVKLLPHGKLVLIDDNPYLVGKARACGTSEGFSVVQQPRLFEHYSILVLEKT